MRRQRGDTCEGILAVIAVIAVIITLVGVGWVSGYSQAQRDACTEKGGAMINGKCLAVKELK